MDLVSLEQMEMKQDNESTQQQKQLEQHFHVLAVDDSLIDRKLLEKLLTVSSYHGIVYMGLWSLDNFDSTV